MYCFGSVRNSLFFINLLRGEASLSLGLRNPGISFNSFSILSTLFLLVNHTVKVIVYNSLSLIWIAYVL